MATGTGTLPDMIMINQWIDIQRVHCMVEIEKVRLNVAFLSVDLMAFLHSLLFPNERLAILINR